MQDGGVSEVGNHWEYGGAVAARVVLADITAALDRLGRRRDVTPAPRRHARRLDAADPYCNPAAGAPDGRALDARA